MSVLNPCTVETAKNMAKNMCAKTMLANNLLDQIWEINGTMGKSTVKNSIDVSNAKKGRNIGILRISTESNRLRSPLKMIIPAANNNPAVSRATSNTESMGNLKPKYRWLKGHKIMTFPTKKSPKAKCCTTATK